MTRILQNPDVNDEQKSRRIQSNGLTVDCYVAGPDLACLAPPPLPLIAACASMPPMHKSLPDLTPLFERYETLCREADALFAHVRAQHADCVACAPGCSGCCHALFDLPLIEAVYLNHAFFRAFPSGAQRSALLDAADAADRAVHKIKRRAFKDWQGGREENVIMTDLARERVRCPLLGENERCLLYDARPLTCRVYGIPLNIGGKGFICGKSGFTSGGNYPAVNLDVLRARLAELSLDLARHTQSGYAEIHTLLVPVSMALLTEYNAGYFGVRGAASIVSPEAKPRG